MKTQRKIKKQSFSTLNSVFYLINDKTVSLISLRHLTTHKECTVQMYIALRTKLPNLFFSLLGKYIFQRKLLLTSNLTLFFKRVFWFSVKFISKWKERECDREKCVRERVRINERGEKEIEERERKFVRERKERDKK